MEKSSDNYGDAIISWLPGVQLYREIESLKDINKGVIFFTGLKASFSKDRVKTISQIGTTALAIAGCSIGLYQGVSAISTGDSSLGACMLSGSLFCLAMVKQYGTPFVVDVMVEGYYSKVSQIVDKHFGGLIGEEEKESFKRKMGELLGSNRIDQVHGYIKTKLKDYALSQVNQKLQLFGNGS